jgi:signal transduction histidine kinase
VVTAYSDIEPILRAINEGLVARYMIKPWQREELVQILRWAVEAWTFGKDTAELQKRLLQTERLATIGMFASMFMHDLRTPVNSAMLNHDMLGELYLPKLEQLIAAAQLPDDKRGEVDEVLADVRRTQADIAVALTMAKDFLAAMSEFGKPIKPGAKPPEADPLAIVRHSVTVCQSLAIKLNAQIDYRVPTTLPHVRIAPVALTQVLVNLLQNGAQAVAARGLKNGQVSIVARARPDEVELRIHDQGVGMPPEVLSRIGTPFYTTRTEGTGLGLAQCQRLVGTAGGRLQIESEPGVGTTVTIILPTAA